MDRKAETKAVKVALKKAGHNCTVKHGTGTAWGWLKISKDMGHSKGCTCSRHSYGVQETCQECKDAWRNQHNDLLAIAMKTTGRHGEYDGRINIYLDFYGDQYEALPIID